MTVTKVNFVWRPNRLYRVSTIVIRKKCAQRLVLNVNVIATVPSQP